MQEFDSVSAPASDPAALCAALNARSALGWSVVSIVPSGSDVTAFLSRDSSGASTSAASSVAPAAEAAPVPVAEPSGWAVSPAPVAQPTPQPVSSYQPAAQPAAQAAPPANSGVPANWYADPSGRFELRYWDGSQWTEHVSRGGQQFTDPPVA